MTSLLIQFQIFVHFLDVFSVVKRKICNLDKAHSEFLLKIDN